MLFDEKRKKKTEEICDHPPPSPIESLKTIKNYLCTLICFDRCVIIYITKSIHNYTIYVYHSSQGDLRSPTDV